MADENGNGTQRKIGEHDAEISSLKDDMAEVKGDVKAILAALNQEKGVKRMIGATMTLVGGAVAGWAATYFGAKP